MNRNSMPDKPKIFSRQKTRSKPISFQITPKCNERSYEKPQVEYNHEKYKVQSAINFDCLIPYSSSTENLNKK